MSERPAGSGGIPPRVWVGLAIALVVALFIALNRQETSISFIVLQATAPLWVALALAGLGGLVAGLMIGRRRHRS